MSLKTHQLKIEYCVQSEIIYIVVKKTTVLYLKLRERLFFLCRLQHKTARADINCQLESFASSGLFLETIFSWIKGYSNKI